MLSSTILLLLPIVFALLCFVLPRRYSILISGAGAVIQFSYFMYLFLQFKINHYQLYNFKFDWIPGLKDSFHIAVDTMSLLPLLLVSLITVIVVLAASLIYEKRDSAYFGLIFLTIAGLNGFFMAQNPITFYLFFELTLIPVYFLVLKWGGPKRKKAVFTFFIYTVFGSFLLLAAIFYIYSFVGINLMTSWSFLYNNHFPVQHQYWMAIVFFIAFGIKAPVFPFHTWQVNLYEQADKPSVILIAALLSKMGVFGFLRFNFITQDVIPKLSFYLIVICVVGVVYGAVVAWRQTNLSRLLAYASMSHMSLLVAGTLTVYEEAYKGAIFQILAHGIAIAGLFFVADVFQRKTGSDNLDANSGMARVQPRFATYYFILVLAAIGLPLTSGFIGEFIMITNVTKFNKIAGAFAGLTIIYGAVYMLQCYQRSMFGKRHDERYQNFQLSLQEDYIFIVLTVLVIALGFFPSKWIDLTAYAIGQFGEYFKY